MPDFARELETILAIGEQIRTDLETGALEQISALIRQRATAVERLHAPGRPTSLPPDGQRVADALAAQHRALACTLAERQQDIETALARLERLNEAHQTYAASPPRPQGVLHRNLCG